MALVMKNLPANTGDIMRWQVQSLGWEDPLEEGMATHSSISAWRTPWTKRSPADYSPYKTHTNTCFRDFNNLRV